MFGMGGYLVKYDVIIIGAGASGLTAAIAAARQGSSVLVIEQKDKAGKKILATGNGKCNFTNKFQVPECYRSDDSAFVMKVLSHFDVTKTLAFFGELGIYPKERDGYYYPNSEQAASVVSVLLLECQRLKIQIHYNETVVNIDRPDFTVVTEVNLSLGEKGKLANSKQRGNNDNKQKGKPTNVLKQSELKNNSVNQMSVSQKELSRKIYYSNRLILATGGCASPSLGSDGKGYEFAKAFGHTIIKPLPALVQLKSTDKYCKTISGVRLNAQVEALSGKRSIAKEAGEILFSDHGISGIPILQLSRFVAKALDLGEDVELRLDFISGITKAELKELLKQRIQQNPAKSAEEMMIGLLNHKLSYVIINEAGIDPLKRGSTISEQELNKIVGNIKEFHMRIQATNSFDNAQVCAGGVSTKEIHEDTMESRLVSGLYPVGELVDVDGTCGGYNLQWAWSSGYLAGTSAGTK
jgi:predicted Rossmann fold flavoprotein